MAFETTAGSAAAGRPPRLGPPRVLAFFFQWNDNPRPFVWTATVDSIQGEALAMSTNAGTDTTGLHFSAQTETEKSVQLILGHYTSTKEPTRSGKVLKARSAD